MGAHILIPDGCYSYPDGPDRLMTSAIVDPCLTRCLVMPGNSYDFFVGCVFFYYESMVCKYFWLQLTYEDTCKSILLSEDPETGSQTCQFEQDCAYIFPNNNSTLIGM